MKGDTENSREESPDWLRCFKAPASFALTLSSDSEPSLHGSLSMEDTVSSDTQSSPKNTLKSKSVKRQLKIEEDQVPNKRRMIEIETSTKTEGKECEGVHSKNEISNKLDTTHDSNFPVLSLSSDSESNRDSSPIRKDVIHPEVLSTQKESQTPKKQKEKVTVEKGENKTEKCVESQSCSSSLPLMLSEKVHRLKALVECEGEAIDMSGDMGAVGRVVISNTLSGDPEMLLDLKGTIFKTTIVPSRTFCVVSFGQSEAKVEAIMNDFIQLKPQSNVFETETMVEGTLDGFSFDSEDEEADKIPSKLPEETEGAEKQNTRKSKGKAEKTSGVKGRKGKAVAGKAPPKKTRKKTQAPKKSKTKK